MSTTQARHPADVPTPPTGKPPPRRAELRRAWSEELAAAVTARRRRDQPGEWHHFDLIVKAGEIISNRLS